MTIRHVLCSDNRHVLCSLSVVPGDKLYNDEAAARAGVSPSAWRDYTTPSKRRGGRLLGPPRDGTDIEGGHARPYWYPETIDAWKASRPGRGARTDLR